jgi:hypothetical protein
VGLSFAGGFGGMIRRVFGVQVPGGDGQRRIFAGGGEQEGAAVSLLPAYSALNAFFSHSSGWFSALKGCRLVRWDLTPKCSEWCAIKSLDMYAGFISVKCLPDGVTMSRSGRWARRGLGGVDSPTGT